MRTRNALERLTAAGRPLLSETDSLVDEGEKDRILARILGSRRPSARRRIPYRLRAGLAVCVAAAVAAAIAVAAHSKPAAPREGGNHQVVLKGARVQMAGYRFRTPVGFKASSSSCPGASSGSGPQTVMNGFTSAASADGGCVEALTLIAGNPSAPPPEAPADSESVAVGSYQGYFVSQGSSGDALYVEIPNATDAQHPEYLILFAQGLTEEQLIAVAESGLPASP